MSSVARGAFLTLMMRWGDRLIGFVSTLILARLLMPQDFGVIAMASMIITLVDVFLDLGVNVSLIQNKNATAAHFNTAWTIRLVQAGLATTIVIAAAPWAAEYFREPRVVSVVQILSLTFLLGAAENIGIVNFQKDMHFGKDVAFFFLKRVFGFLVTLAAALLLRSYWALVIGSLSGRAFGIFLSYRMQPFRPRFSFANFKELFGFSQWILLRNIGLYLDGSLHQFVVGRRESASIVGAYALAGEISAMPTTELLAPVNRVLFPALVNVKHDPAELKRLFLLAQGLHALVGIPAGIGLSLIAGDAVAVLLGDKWLAAVPFVQIIALVSTLNAVVTSGGYVLLTLGRVQSLAFLSLVQVVLFAGIVVFMIPHGRAIEVAWLRLGIALFGLLALILLLVRTLDNVSLKDILLAVTRPAFASVVMVLCVMEVGTLGLFIGIGALALKVSVGLLSYIAAVGLFWVLSGAPRGAESYLLGMVRAFSSAKKRT
jgi:lipopolysaccharide exporter